MKPTKAMMDGWQMMSVIMGENSSAQFGVSYIAAIEREINNFSNVINNTDSTKDYYNLYKNTPVDQQKGNVAEDFQVGSFNVDAIAKSSPLRAIKLGVNIDGSVDACIVDARNITKEEWLHPSDNYDSIVRKSIKNYQMKVYDNPSKAFKALSDLRYLKDNQDALTTSDTKQYLENTPEGRKVVLQRINDQRPDVARGAKHAADTLTDHMEEGGVSAKSATNERYKEMAKGSSGKKEYNPADDGISVENSVTIDLLIKQSLKAGATAAAITFALQLAPEIVKVIDYLHKNGEINWIQIKQFGVKAISSTATSFIRGSVAAGVTIAAKKGLIGEALKMADATTIGAVVSIVMDTIVNSIKLASGKISAKEMGMAFIDSTVVASTFLVSAKIGGAIGQAISPQLPIVGYLIGSLIGCSVCILYNIGKKKFISFCKNSGFTCFGLVDQDYTVPEELLREMGIETAPIERTQIERNGADVLVYQNPVGRTNVDTVSYKIVKRGVIGVNKIEYII